TVYVQISQEGIGFVKQSENCRLEIYNDIAGNASIGWGHLLHRGPILSIEAGHTITQSQADLFLTQDLSWAETEVNLRVKQPLNQNQFDALVDFVYNLGSGTFENSHLLDSLNRGDYASVPINLKQYVHSGGKVIPALVIRRNREAEMFERPI